MKRKLFNIAIYFFGIFGAVFCGWITAQGDPLNPYRTTPLFEKWIETNSY